MSNTVQAAAAQATRPGSGPAGGGRARHRGLAMALILAAQLLVVIDLLGVTLALPAIQRGLGFPPARLQWVLAVSGKPENRGRLNRPHSFTSRGESNVRT